MGEDLTLIELTLMFDWVLDITFAKKIYYFFEDIVFPEMQAFEVAFSLMQLITDFNVYSKKNDDDAQDVLFIFSGALFFKVSRN